MKRARANQGIAVILALAAVLMLVTVALELHLDERANLINAAVMRDRLTLNEMAVSGVHLAMAILIKDRLESEADSLQEDWADEETMATLLDEIPFDQGQLEVKIVDELSKIQINALVRFPEGQAYNDLQRQLWVRFAESFLALYEDLEESDEALEETDASVIIDSVKDWLDSGDDDATEFNGAESDYYEGLDPAYAAKNGPFDHLSEVSLVKGILPEIFMGIGGSAGLADYVTIYGAVEEGDGKFSFPGKININTAELPVIANVLPLESAGLAQLLIDHREATSGSLYTNDLTRADWYQTVPGMGDVTINPDLVTVSSNIFRIVATATLGDVSSTTTAAIERTKPLETEPWQCKILNWKTE